MGHKSGFMFPRSGNETARCIEGSEFDSGWELFFTLMFMLWFNFILGLIFIFFSFGVWIIRLKQKKIKIKPRIQERTTTFTILISLPN